MRFGWDSRKAAENLRAHGVGFDEAATTFGDDAAIERFDLHHSVIEDRWIWIGVSRTGRLLAVAYTVRGDIIWLISARRATKRERHGYEDG